MLEADYTFSCPHCWANISIRLDATGGTKQTFSYDCEVCCRPIRISLAFDEEGIASFEAEKES